MPLPTFKCNISYVLLQTGNCRWLKTIDILPLSWYIERVDFLVSLCSYFHLKPWVLTKRKKECNWVFSEGFLGSPLGMGGELSHSESLLLYIRRRKLRWSDYDVSWMFHYYIMWEDLCDMLEKFRLLAGPRIRLCQHREEIYLDYCCYSWNL